MCGTCSTKCGWSRDGRRPRERDPRHAESPQSLPSSFPSSLTSSVNCLIAASFFIRAVPAFVSPRFCIRAVPAFVSPRSVFAGGVWFAGVLKSGGVGSAVLAAPLSFIILAASRKASLVTNFLGLSCKASLVTDSWGASPAVVSNRRILSCKLVNGDGG